MGGEEVGRLLSRLRREHGLSQADLAARLAEASGNPTITRHEVSRHERGVRTPVYWLRGYAHVLDVPVGELRRAAADGGDSPLTAVATVEDALRVACTWLVTEPAAVEHLRAGRRIGAGLVRDLESRVHELRLLDDHLGGVDTMTVVERELRSAEAVAADASYTERTGRRLFSVIAELSQLAGWTASDGGRLREAERLYLDGVTAAHAARNTDAAANLLSSLSYQVANTGKPSDAVLLAQTAVTGAGEATGRVRALLLERLAWAHARARQAAETDRVLARVDDAYDSASGDGEPAWVYWLDRDEVDVMAGRCYAELRRPLRAAPLLAGAIERYPADRARENALYLTWLAESYRQANEPDAATETLARAQRLATTVQSERLSARLRDLAGAL